MKPISIIFIIIAVFIVLLLPTIADAAFVKKCFYIPGTTICATSNNAGGRPANEEEKIGGYIHKSGSVIDSGTGIGFNVTRMPEECTEGIQYDFRGFAPQDANGIYGLGPLVGVNSKCKNIRTQVRIPVPAGFEDRKLSVARYANGLYSWYPGYRSGNYMILFTANGGDYTVVESAYFFKK